MMYAIICYCIMGVVIGIIFALLFVTFDKAFKRILSSLLSFGGTTSFGVMAGNYFDIKEQKMKFVCSSSLYACFIISFIISMYIMCLIIKDKYDDDVLRIRDIVLGKKSYIDKYYEMRCNQIDEKLDMKKLEKRESEISKREASIRSKEIYIEQELEKINKLGNKKLRLQLPENSNIIITDQFVKTIPSYIHIFEICQNA